MTVTPRTRRNRRQDETTSPTDNGLKGRLVLNEAERPQMTLKTKENIGMANMNANAIEVGEYTTNDSFYRRKKKQQIFLQLDKAPSLLDLNNNKSQILASIHPYKRPNRAMKAGGNSESPYFQVRQRNPHPTPIADSLIEFNALPRTYTGGSRG